MKAHKRSSAGRESFFGEGRIEFDLPAMEAWQFINVPDSMSYSWTIEANGLTYCGCRVFKRKVIDKDNVRITFSFLNSYVSRA